MKKLRFIWMILCVIFLGYSGFRLFSHWFEMQQGKQAYEQLGGIRASFHLPAPSSSSKDRPIKISVPEHFSSLLSSYPDMCAWLYCEGTPIDYPVMQGKDNTYYLSHLYNKTKHPMGSFFLSAENTRDFSDQNSIIYGHNMKNTSMFSTLPNYKDQAYYEAHPILYLFTPARTYRVELFAGYILSGTTGFFPSAFPDNTAFHSYLETLRLQSTFQSDVTVSTDNRILTLCTCTYDFKNARYALVGKLVPLA